MMSRRKSEDEVGMGVEGDETKTVLELDLACDFVCKWPDHSGWHGLGFLRGSGYGFGFGLAQIRSGERRREVRGLKGLRGACDGRTGGGEQERPQGGLLLTAREDALRREKDEATRVSRFGVARTRIGRNQGRSFEVWAPAQGLEG
ncbi:hypothetical protein CLAIMM_10731 [Cladophialophora immunda]|nr:hypothetical protein CLAIMM_10731 [Cladophialophora immunda]